MTMTRRAKDPVAQSRSVAEAYRQVDQAHGRAPLRDVCVVVADDVRARVLVHDVRHDHGDTGAQLVQVSEITNPMLRARDVDQHGRREVQRHFAARIAEEAAGVWRRFPSCELIVAASPRVLGLLRPAIERQIRPTDRIEVHELARELTKSSTPTLHDVLAESGLLPPREAAGSLHSST